VSVQHPHPAQQQHLARLRTVLRLNAASSAAAGAAALIAAGPVADLLDVDRPGLVRLVGAGLLLFAVNVALIAGTRPARLVAGAVAVSAVDAAWVVATVVLCLAGAFGGPGVAVALAMGVVVGALAEAQLLGVSRARRVPDGSPTVPGAGRAPARA
jgi:hypothetical protein